MRQIWTGPPDDARDIIRSLVMLGVDRIGFLADALGQLTVFVGDDYLEEARALLDAIHEIEILAAHTRVRYAVAFRGGRDVGGAA